MKIKLGDICTFKSGGTPTKGTEEFFNGTIPWITTTALNGGKIDGTQAVNWITEKAIEKSAAKLVPAFSIMVGTRVGVGKVAVNTVQMSTSQDIISLIKIDENRWDKDYLCKYIQGKNAFLNSQARGATIKGIKMDVLANLELEEITLENQARISETIDRVKVILDARKNELLELDKLVKARFAELFGHPDINEKEWKVNDMDQLCEVSSSKRIYQNEQSMTGIPFLRISDLVNRMDAGTKECDLHIPKVLFEELKDKGLVPSTGDILLTARGTLGRCYIVQEDDEFYFQDGMITWLSKFDSEITPLYISCLFEMPGFRKQIDELQAGSTVAYLSISMTKKLKVMVPPVELQNQFADFVHQVDKSKLLEERQVRFIAKISQKPGRQISFCRFDRFDYN